MENHSHKYNNGYAKIAPGIIGKNAMYGQYPHGTQGVKASTQLYHPKLQANSAINTNYLNNPDSLSDGFGRMNVHSHGYQGAGKSNQPLSAATSEYGGVQLTQSIPPAFVYNGQFMFANPGANQASGQNHLSIPQSMYPPVGPTYVNSNGYPPYPTGLMHANSPLTQNWGSSRVPSSDMPTLITPRRDSNSSNEVDGPGTPFTQYTTYNDHHGSVTVIDRSPNGSYAWSTPSPPQGIFTNGKQRLVEPIPNDILELIQQDPPIPRAIPAPYSPMKPLDRSLENNSGVTNVYIRGLLPETTDEMLFKLAARFGDIISHKSIIDHSTGLCKGYGFVKYHSYKDAEKCIRGFHYQGYETSFARESFYSQLKKLSDEKNTNLYVSNLPKDMNEHELGAIFTPHKVCSSRILRDSAGNGRGVGFARFESREICEEVIKTFNNTPIAKESGEEHLIQIRYADTQDQKVLKQHTTAARQYRTAEYESQTQGHLNPYTAASSRTEENDFERFLTNNGPSVGNAFVHNGYGRVIARDRLNTVSSHLNSSHLNGSVKPRGVSAIKLEPEVHSSDEGDKHDKAYSGTTNSSIEKSASALSNLALAHD